MFLGIDLGTSSLKVVLLDNNEKLIDSVSMPLSVQHPQPGFSEQHPDDWWQALQQAMLQFKKTSGCRIAAGPGDWFQRPDARGHAAG